MDIVKRLRNYTIILFLISIGSTASMIVLGYLKLRLMYVDESLINTIIASFYAVTIAVFIYWQQQKHKYQSMLKTYESFLEYISEIIDKNYFLKKNGKIKDIEINVLSINTSFIDTLIQSGYFNEIIRELSILQNRIHLYNNAVESYIISYTNKKDDFEKLELAIKFQKAIEASFEEIQNKKVF